MGGVVGLSEFEIRGGLDESSESNSTEEFYTPMDLASSIHPQMIRRSTPKQASADCADMVESEGAVEVETPESSIFRGSESGQSRSEDHSGISTPNSERSDHENGEEDKEGFKNYGMVDILGLKKGLESAEIAEKTPTGPKTQLRPDQE
jgi:hypothetical protein